MKKSAIGLTISSAVMAIGGFLLIYFFNFMPNVNETISLLMDVFLFKDSSYQIISIALWFVDGLIIVFFILDGVFIVMRKQYLYLIVDLLGILIMLVSTLIMGFYVPQLSNAQPDLLFLISVSIGFALSSILLIIDYIVLFGYLVTFSRRQARLEKEKEENKNTIFIHDHSSYTVKYNATSNFYEIIEKANPKSIVNYSSLGDAIEFAKKYLLTNHCKVTIYDKEGKQISLK
jgi:hypothetical protein